MFFFRYEIENCSVIWAIKDEHISTTFFDEAAARFFLDRIQIEKQKEKLNEKRVKYETTGEFLSAFLIERRVYFFSEKTNQLRRQRSAVERWDRTGL